MARKSEKNLVLIGDVEEIREEESEEDSDPVEKIGWSRSKSGDSEPVLRKEKAIYSLEEERIRIEKQRSIILEKGDFFEELIIHGTFVTRIQTDSLFLDQCSLTFDYTYHKFYIMYIGNNSIGVAIEYDLFPNYFFNTLPQSVHFNPSELLSIHDTLTSNQFILQTLQLLLVNYIYIYIYRCVKANGSVYHGDGRTGIHYLGR